MKKNKENEGLNEYINRVNKAKQDLFHFSGIPKEVLQEAANAISKEFKTIRITGNKEFIDKFNKDLDDYDSIREE
jgi:hypothetical protein